MGKYNFGFWDYWQFQKEQKPHWISTYLQTFTSWTYNFVQSLNLLGLVCLDKTHTLTHFNVRRSKLPCVFYKQAKKNSVYSAKQPSNLQTWHHYSPFGKFITTSYTTLHRHEATTTSPCQEELQTFELVCMLCLRRSTLSAVKQQFDVFFLSF